MKRLILAFLLAVTMPLAQTACQSQTSQQNAVLTLKISGETAKAAMDGATLLLKDGHITVAQWQKVADAYQFRFQPAFNLAVTAAQGNYTALSPADVSAALSELLTLTQAFK